MPAEDASRVKLYLRTSTVYHSVTYFCGPRHPREQATRYEEKSDYVRPLEDCTSNCGWLAAPLVFSSARRTYLIRGFGNPFTE